jgi:hypothetical protein
VTLAAGCDAGSTVATNAPNSTINGGNLGGYLYADDGFNYWTVMNGYEFDSYNTHRLLQFGDIDREASANYNGWQAYVYAERGVSFQSAPKQQTWSGKDAVFIDPDGKQFHLALSQANPRVEFLLAA